jgi:hypothetical protein
MAGSSDAKLLPSSVPATRQPYGLNQVSGVPWTTLLMRWSSMPQSFQSSR